MSTDLKVIEDAYLRDILDQPQALENTLAILAKLTRRELKDASPSVVSYLADWKAYVESLPHS